MNGEGKKEKKRIEALNLRKKIPPLSPHFPFLLPSSLRHSPYQSPAMQTLQPQSLRKQDGHTPGRRWQGDVLSPYR